MIGVGRIYTARTRRVVTFVGIILLLMAVACNMPGCGTGPEPTPSATATPTIDVAQLPPTQPQIVLQRPYVGEELPLDGSIDVYFDQPMDRQSVEDALSIDPPIEVDLTWVDDSTLRVTPKAGQIERAAKYTITITEKAVADNGLAMKEYYRADVQSVGFLEVGEVVPDRDATAVETDSVITVFFNRPVVPLVIAEEMEGLPDPLTFSPDIPGEGEWVNTSIYTWHPSEPLAGGQTYTVTVPAGLEDMTGGLLAESFSWKFTTIPPSVLSTYPTTEKVAPDRPVKIEFNQAMDRASVEAAFALFEIGGSAVAGSFEWEDGDKLMIFRPSSMLNLNTTYNPVLRGTARSANGELTIGDEYNWTFNTVPYPAITGSSPGNGSPNVQVWNGIKIYFISPMDDDTLADKLVVEPALPEDTYYYYSSYDTSWVASGELEPSTTYSVTFLPGAADLYGNTITEPYSFSFTTGPLDPWVYLNVQGSYGVYNAARPSELFISHRNVSKISFTLSRLSLNDFGQMTSDYWIFQEYYPEPSLVVREWSIQSEGGLNELVYSRVPLVDQAGMSLSPGMYLLIVDAPEIEGDLRHIMLVVTDNLTFKSSFEEGLVWMTDLQTGQPVGGQYVQFYGDGMTPIGNGTTGPDGTLKLDLPEIEAIWDARYALVNTNDGHFAVALTEWDEGIQPWQFGSISSRYYAEHYSIYLYTDRPLYRPGQEVFYKGILRNKDDVTYTLPPAGTSVDVIVSNDFGDIVYEGSLPVNELGSFNGSFTLDDEAGLGYYSIQVTTGDLSTGIGFQVAEYRKPEFFVNIETDADQYVDGDQIEVTVDSEFFFGGPVSDASVSWTVLTTDYYFDYTGPQRYSFNDIDDSGWWYYDWYDEDYYYGYGTIVTEGSGQTDENGQLVIQVPASLDAVSGSQRFTIEATVTDVDERSVSGRTEVIVHQGEVYPGVRSDVYVATAGDDVSVSLVAVDWDSEPVVNQEMTVEFIAYNWKSVQEEDESGRLQWTWSIEEEPIGDPVTVKTDRNGKATASFVPEEGGTYIIRATVKDAAGRTQRSASYVWVSSPRYVSWRRTNDDRIDLITDQDSYKPGDTAEILIASPFQGSDVKALVSIERGSLLTHEVITLTNNSTVYKLPITGDLAPNIYVSVVIVKGVDDTNPVPAFKVGLTEIVVEPVEQTLNVTVTPDSDMVGPREEVTYTVETTDFEGDPVDAEVSLALVDLATLSLAEPNTGPIVDYFYGEQGIAVRTSMPLIFLVDRITQDLLDEGKGGGGGGGGGFYEVRTEFEDTAYWTATVRTGDDGQAEVSVTLPDNLTTWRMDARAVTGDTLVGQTTVDIIATRPLLVRPVTPRFFVAGDEATLSAVVNNNTGEAVEATVSLDVEGVDLQSDKVVVLDIPVGGRAEAFWEVSVDPNAEWVDLVFAVEGGGYSDASKPTLGDPDNDQQLPVYRYEVPETVGTAGQLIEEGSRVEGIVLPPTYEITAGEVEVHIDPSLAAATLDGLRWLEHYPYECTEQTVSRFLPNVLTMRAYQEFNLSDAELEENLQEQISIGLQRLYAQQHVDGGWGWFVQSNSNPTVTAYVVQGLVAAQQTGYTVEQRALDAGIAYLQSQLIAVDESTMTYQLNRQAYVLYVLAEAGHPDVSRTTSLFEVRERMQTYARAQLALTLSLIDPTDPRIETLKSDIINAAILSATGAHWEEESADTWNWNTDTRTTAIVLDAFARLWPENDLGPNTVRWLMVVREGGHWETTQETAWAIIGLTDWMMATGELDASYTWSMEFNTRPTAEGAVSPSTVRNSTVITIDVREMLRDNVNTLMIDRSAGPGRLYYTAHLSVDLPVEEVDPLSRGVIVSRRYLNADGNAVTSGKVGDVLTVELTIIAPHDLYYVVVDDPYPAGVEAVNLELETESIVGERPTLRPTDPLAYGWGWWWFSQTDLRDEKAVLFADYLPAGTYQYTYQVRLSIPGTYHVIPAVAQEFYFPEVYGRGEGMLFTIEPSDR
ncbi:MAG: Ig-like domain-containing protein [Anaerolineae bacterium]|nr:Ig-like domain-containing protein [Anaerolineae bacterium]